MVSRENNPEDVRKKFSVLWRGGHGALLRFSSGIVVKSQHMLPVRAWSRRYEPADAALRYFQLVRHLALCYLKVVRDLNLYYQQV